MKEYTLETMAISSPQKASRLTRKIFSLKTFINFLRVFIGIGSFAFLLKIDLRFLVRAARLADLKQIHVQPLIISYLTSAITVFNLISASLIVLIGHWTARVKRPALALCFAIFSIVCVLISVGLAFYQSIVWNRSGKQSIQQPFIDKMTKYMRIYSFDETNASEKPHTKTWDLVQQTRKCCGLHDPLDWEAKRPFDDRSLPNSCCPLPVSYGHVFNETGFCTLNDEQHFKIGCFKKIDLLVRNQLDSELYWLYLLGATAFAALLLYILVKKQEQSIRAHRLEADAGEETQTAPSEQVNLREVGKGRQEDGAAQVGATNPVLNGDSASPPKYMDALQKAALGGTSV